MVDGAAEDDAPPPPPLRCTGISRTEYVVACDRAALVASRPYESSRDEIDGAPLLTMCVWYTGMEVDVTETGIAVVDGVPIVDGVVSAVSGGGGGGAMGGGESDMSRERNPELLAESE